MSQTVNAGQSVTFTAVASGNPVPDAQWQVSTDGGTSWANLPNATSASYTFIAQATDDGKQFRVAFTNSMGETGPSNAATLTVDTSPIITAHPESITVAAGQTASFTAAAIGNPTPTVQWQVSTNNGKAWKNISGATSTTYSFTAQTADSGKQFRAVFANHLGTATTNVAKLTVTANTGSAPIITTQPVSQTVADGQTASFTAVATGNPTPTIQWQVSTDNGSNWTNISGATSTTYTFTAYSANDGNQFRAVFTNSNGTATSNAATLTVSSTSTSAPVITFQPASKSVKAGTLVTFTAAASGNPTPTVQWQVSTNKGRTWTDISGATDTSYSFTAQKTDSGNQYHAVFNNSAGTAITNAATLTVR
jgi:hypothetical protein